MIYDTSPDISWAIITKPSLSARAAVRAAKEPSVGRSPITAVIKEPSEIYRRGRRSWRVTFYSILLIERLARAVWQGGEVGIKSSLDYAVKRGTAETNGKTSARRPLLRDIGFSWDRIYRISQRRGVSLSLSGRVASVRGRGNAISVTRNYGIRFLATVHRVDEVRPFSAAVASFGHCVLVFLVVPRSTRGVTAEKCLYLVHA